MPERTLPWVLWGVQAALAGDHQVHIGQEVIEAHQGEYRLDAGTNLHPGEGQQRHRKAARRAAARQVPQPPPQAASNTVQ